jgi:hypothetical protein
MFAKADTHLYVLLLSPANCHTGSREDSIRVVCHVLLAAWLIGRRRRRNVFANCRPCRLIRGISSRGVSAPFLNKHGLVVDGVSSWPVAPSTPDLNQSTHVALHQILHGLGLAPSLPADFNTSFRHRIPCLALSHNHNGVRRLAHEKYTVPRLPHAEGSYDFSPPSSRYTRLRRRRVPHLGIYFSWRDVFFT